jgi:ParB/RepB/Spo0J family partition protein
MKAEETAGAVAEPETKSKATETTPHPTLSPKGARETKAAPEQLGVIEGGEYKDLAVADLVESPTNPRKHYDPADLKEFAENIRTTGVLQPIVCRRLKSGKIEVVLGSRRLRASKLAGKKTIPARIVEISDMAAAEAQLIENLMRVNPHPMEEALGYQDLIEKHKRTVEQIATKLGKSASYIYMTLVLTKLAPAVRDMFLSGKWGKDGDEGSFTKNHAQMLARLQHEAQKQAFEQFRWDGAPSTRDLADWIQRDVYMNLDKAPWKLDDAKLLPAAGACSSCPKLSGNNPFFADLKHKSCCTDRVCFDQKTELQLEQAKLEAAKKLAQRQAEERAEKTKDAVIVMPLDEKKIAAAAKEILQLSGSSYSSDKKILSSEHWVKAKVACSDPKPAVVVVEGYDRAVKVGQQLDVCINTKCKSCWSKEERADSERHDKYRNQERAKEQRARKATELRELTLLAILGKFEKAETEDVELICRFLFQRMHHDGQVRLVKLYGWDCGRDWQNMKKALDAHLAEADGAMRARFCLACCLIGDTHVSVNYSSDSDDLNRYAKRFKIDPKKLEKPEAAAKVSPPIKGGNTPAPKKSKTKPAAAAKPAKKPKAKKKK